MNEELDRVAPETETSNPPVGRIAFVDLDDTLLGPDKKISQPNLKALDTLRAAGVEVVVASGRHHHNVRMFREIGDMRWIVSSQGGMVGHVKSGKNLREVTLDAALAAELCERGRELGMTLMAYDRNGARAEVQTPWTDLYASKAGWQPALGDFRALPPDSFVKILWSGEPSRIRSLAAELEAEMRTRLQMVVTELELLEFTALGATKATGAAALAEHLGLNSGHAMAFGDGNNDVEILQWAGISVAMAHGKSSAHRAARFISPPGPPETAFARAVDLALSCN